MDGETNRTNMKLDLYQQAAWLRGTVVERRLWPANFPCPALDLQLMGDHYCV